MGVIEHVSIAEAAERLGVSADTVRRRLKRGELTGEQETTPQGFVWRVALPIAEGAPEPPGAAETPGDAIELARLRERVIGLERLADELQGERDAWREQAARDGDAARELRILLRQAQALAQALPTHVEPPSGVNTPDAPPPQEDSRVLGHRAWLAGLWERLRAH